jgi:hypothetical protein
MGPRICDVCGRSFTPRSSQSKRCSDECRRAKREVAFDAVCPGCGGRMYRYRNVKLCRSCADKALWENPPDRTAPECVPGPLEIGFAAGFYEGEGSVGCHKGGLRVTLPQADPQPLEYIRRFFGGNLSGPRAHSGHLGDKEMYYLYLTSKRAWDFLAAIGPLLSDRRIDQAVSACACTYYFRGQEVVLR